MLPFTPLLICTQDTAMSTPPSAFKRRFLIIALTSFILVFMAGCARETSEEAIAYGQSALLSGDYSKAVGHLQRAVKLNSDNEIILYNLGMAHLLTKNYKAAEKVFDASDRLNKDNGTEALEGLAQARRLAGDYEGAIRAFTRAFEKVNRKAHLVAGLAVCEMEQGNNEYAHQLLLQALATDNTDPVAMFNMAVLMQKPQFEASSQAAEMYVRFIISTRSSMYPAELKRATETIKTINANRPDERQMKIDDLLVRARMAKNKTSALDCVIEAVMLDQSNPDAFLALIKTLRSMGRTAQAEIITKRFLAIFPDDPRTENL